MRTGPHGETPFDDGDTFTVRMTDPPINHDFVNLPDNWTYDSEPVLEAFEQSLIAPIATPEPVQVDALDATERGDGGFGSTGRA